MKLDHCKQHAGSDDDSLNCYRIRHDDGRPASDYEVMSRIDAQAADMARVSAELGLPPTIGPAPGYLSNLVKTNRAQAAEIAAYELTVANLRAAQGVATGFALVSTDTLAGWKNQVNTLAVLSGQDRRERTIKLKQGIADVLAAAPQPAAQPEPKPTSVSKSKRAQMEARGYVVNGVAMMHPETRRRVLLDYCGFVGWWHGQVHHDQQAQAERKPMTLHQMMHYLPQGNADAGTVSAIAVAVEKFHGIKDTK